MKKLEKLIEKILLPIANWVSVNKTLTAIKDGMMYVMPLLLVGSILLVITNFPYIEVLLPNVDLWGIFGSGYQATMGIVALVASFTIAYAYANSNEANGVYSGITSLASFLLLTEIVEGNVAISSFGSQSLFTVLIIAVITSRIYTLLETNNIIIKMPESVPPAVAKSFTSVIPMFIVVLVMITVKTLFGYTEYGSFHNFIYSIITQPLLGLANFKYSIVIANFLVMLFWFFGLHGGMLNMAIFGSVFTTMSVANTDAFVAGQKIPYIASQVFNNAYGTMAAAGVLAAVVAAMIVGKSKTTKSISKLGIVPAIFGIQEPFHFGFPTFMNPIMFIPYVLVPTLITYIGFTLVELGIAPMPIIDVPWTTPILIQGFISCNYNIMGAVIQALLFALAVLIYIPFIKIADGQYRKQEAEGEIQIETE